MAFRDVSFRDRVKGLAKDADPEGTRKKTNPVIPPKEIPQTEPPAKQAAIKSKGKGGRPKNKSPNSYRVLTYINAETMNRLKEKSYNDRRSIAEIARFAIEDYLRS